MVQIYGTCEDCREGRTATGDDGHSDLVFARDALRIAIATERSGLEFYTRAAKVTRDARARVVFEHLAAEEKEHLGKLEARYAELLQRDRLLESRPTFLFFKGAASGIFAEGTERLVHGNDQQALLIGIKCERGSHRFFKKYGEQFEESEGKQIFLEFADEEREHLDLLMREYRALVKRQGKAGRAALDLARQRAVIDLHLHTIASDGRSTPSELVDLAAAAGLTAMAVTDHDTTVAVEDVRQFAAQRGIEAVPGIEITAVLHGRDVHMLGYFFEPRYPGLVAFLAEQREERIARVEAIVERLAELKMPINFKAQIEVARRPTGTSLARPHVARAMVAAGYVKTVQAAFDLWLAEGRPAFIERVGPSPAAVAAIVHAAGGLLSLAHPGRTRVDEEIPAMVAAGLDALEVFHSDHDAGLVSRYLAMATELGLSDDRRHRLPRRSGVAADASAP